MPYKKSDMVYQDYKWDTKYTNDDPKITGEPDSTLLARTEGWEMLYFINKLGDVWKWSSDDIVAKKKLEKTIRTMVPSNTRSQEGIRKWIESNYSTFWASL